MDKRFDNLIEIGRALKPSKQTLRAFHVAAIYKKNKLISIGFNCKKTHPKVIKYGYPYPVAIHAETLSVIRGKLENYKGFELFVIRISNENKIVLSRPCSFCEKLIKLMQFDRVYFSNENGLMIKF